MNKSDSLNELASALSKAQSEITGAKTDSTNPFFKSKYASLESVYHAINVPFSKNGLAVTQTTTWEETMGVAIVTTLMHSSGQWIEGILPIMAVKQDPQGIGSAITYSRRAALKAIAGIYEADDDGESHAQRAKPELHSSPKQQLGSTDAESGISQAVKCPSCRGKMMVSQYSKGDYDYWYCSPCKKTYGKDLKEFVKKKAAPPIHDGDLPF